MSRRRRWLLAFVVIAALAMAPLVWFYWPTPSRLVGAVAEGNIGWVRLYLTLGVDPNGFEKWGWYDDDGRTPLTTAAQFGRGDIISLLLAHGANVNQRDFGVDHPHNTPLTVAAMHRQLEACRVLLAAGADPNVPNDPHGGNRNWTALDWALQARPNDAVIALLREHGAKESPEHRAQYGPAPE